MTLITGANGLKNFNYNAFTGPLIEAVKEQQREIRRMQGEISDLKQKLSNLKPESTLQLQFPSEESPDFPTDRNCRR